MEWLLIALVAGGGGLLTKRWTDRRAHRRDELAELEGVRRLADEDVTYLGEQLQRLDHEVAGRELDEAARVDYQTALDAYESAQRAVTRISTADEISTVTDTLAAGRYALACPGQGVRSPPPRAAGALLLQPAARTVGDRRDVDAARARHPQRAGLCSGRRSRRRP